MLVTELDALVDLVDDELLNETEAAEFLGVSPRTMQRWRRHNIGPSYLHYNGFRIKYRKSVLAVYLAQSVKRTAEPAPQAVGR
jgi:hypothetical protein